MCRETFVRYSRVLMFVILLAPGIANAQSFGLYGSAGPTINAATGYDPATERKSSRTNKGVR